MTQYVSMLFKSVLAGVVALFIFVGSAMCVGQVDPSLSLQQFFTKTLSDLGGVVYLVAAASALAAFAYLVQQKKYRDDLYEESSDDCLFPEGGGFFTEGKLLQRQSEEIRYLYQNTATRRLSLLHDKPKGKQWRQLASVYLPLCDDEDRDNPLNTSLLNGNLTLPFEIEVVLGARVFTIFGDALFAVVGGYSPEEIRQAHVSDLQQKDAVGFSVQYYLYRVINDTLAKVKAGVEAEYKKSPRQNLTDRDVMSDVFTSFRNHYPAIAFSNIKPQAGNRIARLRNIRTEYNICK